LGVTLAGFLRHCAAEESEVFNNAKGALRLFASCFIPPLWSPAMFDVHVDISLFRPGAAFGMISGTLRLPVIPQTGDMLSFQMTRPVEALRGSLPFHGLLQVTDRIISSGGVSVLLEDLTAATDDHARSIIKSLEDNHGLFGDIWEN
jgi:hypothetical protein